MNNKPLSGRAWRCLRVCALGTFLATISTTSVLADSKQQMNIVEKATPVATAPMQRTARVDENKVILYPRFLITHAADFAAFQEYMSETKEEYRRRRAGELISQSQGMFGTNPELVMLMMDAYKQFDGDYYKNKSLSRIGIGTELAGQLRSALDTLKHTYMLSDKSSSFLFTYGDRSTAEMQQLVDASYGRSPSDETSAADMASIANHFLYGFWSEYGTATDGTQNIKITVILEEIGGKIETFESVGSARGEAMQDLAKKIFIRLQSGNGYADLVNPNSHLKLRQPVSLQDTKTFEEARAFCKLQSTPGEDYRLPYAQEVLNMPNLYAAQGSVFIDTDAKTYAVADKRGGNSSYKVIAASSSDGVLSRVQRALPQEKLSYFCVSGAPLESVSSVEHLYNELHDKFSQLNQSLDGNITRQVCQDRNNAYGVSELKDLAVSIKQKDRSSTFKGMIEQCVVHYLKAHNNPGEALSLMRTL